MPVPHFRKFLFPLLLVGIYFYFFRSLLLGTHFGQHDFFKGYLIFTHVAEYFGQGLFPLWDPYTNGGQPAYLLPSHQSLNPLTLLIYLVTPNASHHLDFVWVLYFLIGHLLYAAGTGLWLREVLSKPRYALLGFAAVLFSSVALWNFESPVLYKCWAFPWLLFGIEKIVKGDRKYFYFLATILAMLSFYFYCLYSLVTTGVYCAFRWAPDLYRFLCGQNRLARIKNLARNNVGILLTCFILVLLAARISIHLLQDQHLLSISHRTALDLRDFPKSEYEKIQRESILVGKNKTTVADAQSVTKPLDLVPLVFPYLLLNGYSIFEWRFAEWTSETFITLGSLGFLLILAGFILKRGYRPYVGLTLAFVLLVALQWPLWTILVKLLPPLATIRHTFIFASLVFPLFAFYLCEGAANLVEPRVFKKFCSHSSWFLGLSIIVSALCFYRMGWNPFRVLFTQGLLIALLLACRWKARALASNGIWVFLALLLIDQVGVLAHYKGYYLRLSKQDLQPIAPTEQGPVVRKGMFETERYNSNLPYATTGPLFFKEHTEMISHGFYTLNNFTYLYKGTPLNEKQLAEVSRVGKPIAGFIEKSIPESELSGIKLEEIDFASTAIVSATPEGREFSSQGVKGEVFSSHHGRDRARFEVQNDGSALFYFADGYHPYWKVLVDGVQKELLRVNWNYKGVYLPPGKHSVEFIFEHPTYVMDLALHGGSVLLLAALFFTSSFLPRLRF